MFGRERCENVNVVGRSIDDERLAVTCADDAAEIWKQTRFQIRVEQWSPVFRAENDMCQQMSERVRHRISRSVGDVRATEWREIVAHGDNRGNEL